MSEVIRMGLAMFREAKEFIDIVMGPAESMQFILIKQFISTIQSPTITGGFPGMLNPVG